MITAIIVACLGSFRSLFSHQESASQPIKYNPFTSCNVFLQGSSSGRTQIRDTVESLVGTSSHKTHIQSESMDSRNIKRKDSSFEFIIPMDSVHVKQEFEISHDVV